MPQLPDGDPAPADGTLPASVTEDADGRALTAYVHVPFCAVRCGYCDFNTYVASELGPGSGPAEYLGGLDAEIGLAARVLEAASLPARPLSSVFFGGGTPTLLPADELVRILARLRDTFGVAGDAEVTTEANPDSVTEESLVTLAEGGITRVSFGMQSAVPHVLAALDRTHDPHRVGTAVAAARRAGLDVSVDLIYGAPGESVGDWVTSVRAALDLEPDHISAYALTVEPGTRLHSRVRRGELPDVDPDDQATKYERADELFTAGGLAWYEISNWSTGEATRCRHNVSYWRGDDWWGFGPGAHSHVGGVRWWNVKHPHRFAQLLVQGRSPAAAREVLTGEQRALEQDMLGIRLGDGFTTSASAAAEGLVADGLLVARPGGRYRLTQRGRLLADRVTTALAGF